MVRAIAFCALFIAVHADAAGAQSVTPRIIATPESGPEPALGISDATSAPAPDEHELHPSTTEAVEKPVDKHALLRQKLAEMNCLQSEIDELRIATGTPQSVHFEIVVLEVSRTKLEKSGKDFDALFANGNVSDEQLSWLRDNNFAKVLAEPSLAVVCGRPAQFEVGSEVPIPAAAESQQPVEFQKIGTQINLTAFAQGENRLRLEVRARVSDIDTANTLDVAGNRVPAFKIRQIDSAAETEIGRTVALSSMTQHRTEAIKTGEQITNVNHDIELLFLVKSSLIPAKKNQNPSDAAPYRTANSASDAKPNERSLRVTKPYSAR